MVIEEGCPVGHVIHGRTVGKRFQVLRHELILILRIDSVNTMIGIQSQTDFLEVGDARPRIPSGPNSGEVFERELEEP